MAAFEAINHSLETLVRLAELAVVILTVWRPRRRE